MFVTLPSKTDGTAFYETSFDLDGTEFIFEFKFNSRDGHWYLSVRTVEGEPIKGCENRKLVAGWVPLRLSRALEAPKGVLLVSGPLTQDPGLNDLGTTFELVYQPYTAPTEEPAYKVA